MSLPIEIVTYKNTGPDGIFCQIKLNSGERVLISVGSGYIKIFKLLFGFFPIKTIWGPKSVAEASYIAKDYSRCFSK